MALDRLTRELSQHHKVHTELPNTKTVLGTLSPPEAYHLASTCAIIFDMTDPTFHITSSRLTLSYLDPQNPAHCSFLVSLWNTPEFISMLGGKPTSITTPAAAKALISTRFVAEHARNGYGTYLVSLRPENTPIGTVSLMRGENSSLLAPDVGFALLSEHMRKGYAVEAAKALLDYVDREKGVTAVFGFCDEKNEASMGVLRKLGFKWEGVKKVEELGGKEAAVWSWGMETVEHWGLVEA